MEEYFSDCLQAQSNIVWDLATYTLILHWPDILGITQYDSLDSLLPHHLF